MRHIPRSPFPTPADRFWRADEARLGRRPVDDVLDALAEAAHMGASAIAGLSLIAFIFVACLAIGGGA